ncbi:extracellular solute-binding protein, partial [Lactococcus lactis]
PNVAAFNSDNPANPYMEGEVNLGMVWNGSAWVARQAGTPLEIVWPKEGGIFWMDSLSIPANAKNVDEKAANPATPDMAHLLGKEGDFGKDLK